MISSVQLGTLPVTVRKSSFELRPIKRKARKAELSFYLSSLDQLKAVAPYADRVYYDDELTVLDATDICRGSDIEMVFMLPRVSPMIQDVNADALLASTLGQVSHFRGKRIYGSHSMNFFNSMTIPDLYQYTMSVELSRDDMRAICSHYSGKLEQMVFGRMELMVTRDPSIPTGVLVDERSKRFEVTRDHHGYAHIKNSSDLFLLDFLDEMDRMNIDSYGIDLRGRRPELCSLVAEAFGKRDMRLKGKIKHRCGMITAGNYLRGVQ